MAKLLVQESDGTREFELVDLEVNIGRELDNTLRLADPSVSRHHAVVRLGPSGYEIHDLQSSNGVLLNGNRVPSAPLHDGDRITLGQMQITFADPQPAQGSSPLGTVRMAPEAMARLRASTVPPEAPGPSAAPAAPAGPSRPKPGPAFLHPWLPDLPDRAVPLLDDDGAPLRASFMERLLAGLIDFAPMLALNILATLFSLGFLPVLGCLLGIVQLALLAGYLILLPIYWMRLGASPGKKLMRLRVVPEGRPEGRIDLNDAILRLLGYLSNAAISWFIMDLVLRSFLPHVHLWTRGPEILLLKAVGLVAWILPYLLILGASRKALQDLFSRSIVIRVDR